MKKPFDYDEKNPVHIVKSKNERIIPEQLIEFLELGIKTVIK